MAVSHQPQAQRTVLTEQPTNQADAWRMIRRRAAAAGIMAPIGNQDLLRLEQGSSAPGWSWCRAHRDLAFEAPQAVQPRLPRPWRSHSPMAPGMAGK